VYEVLFEQRKWVARPAEETCTAIIGVEAGRRGAGRVPPARKTS